MIQTKLDIDLKIGDYFTFESDVYYVKAVKVGGLFTVLITNKNWVLPTRAFIYNMLNKKQKYIKKITKDKNPEYFL